jgi:hypothetical protein
MAERGKQEESFTTCVDVSEVTDAPIIIDALAAWKRS